MSPNRSSYNAAPKALPNGKVIFGTSALGNVLEVPLVGRADRLRGFKLLDEVYETGCRVFDLGRSYQAGGTERLFGHWLKQSKIRKQLFLISKGGHPLPIVAPFRLGKRDLESDLQKSLDVLGIEAFDMYMLHRDHPQVDLVEVGSFLASVKSRGLSQFTGVSNWSFERIQALENAVETKIVDASSPQLSLSEWATPKWKGCVSIAGRKHKYERNLYAKENIPVFAYSCLGHGWLSSSDKKSRIFAARHNELRRQRCAKLAAEMGVSLATMAIAYVLSQPFPSCAIVRSSSGKRMKDNQGAEAIELSADQLRWLEQGELR